MAAPFCVGVGKSCILTRLTKGLFDQDHNMTLGVEFGSCLLKVEEMHMKIQIWDTAGQESFRSVTKIFYKGASAIFLCYAINSRQSFDNLRVWLQEIEQECSNSVQIFLVGTKQDLESEREVSSDAARRF